jgi:hypothetical protein
MKAMLHRIVGALSRLAMRGGVAALSMYAPHDPATGMISLPLTPRPSPGNRQQGGTAVIPA